MRTLAEPADTYRTPPPDARADRVPGGRSPRSSAAPSNASARSRGAGTMRMMERRIRSLEKQLAPLQRDRSQNMRLIFSVVSQQATLANCRCTRTLTNRVLSEAFIQTFRLSTRAPERGRSLKCQSLRRCLGGSNEIHRFKTGAAGASEPGERGAAAFVDSITRATAHRARTATDDGY
jgi:hypothetical protein